MEKKETAVPLLLASSPHIASPVNSRALMGNMYMALAPVAIFGVVIFGLPALLNIIVAMASAILGETLFRLAIKQRPRVKDLSAGLSGLLLALVIPPSMPLWMTALGSLFAVVVAKEFFGGLGANVFNPALTGRAFLLMSFPVAMSKWHEPVSGFALTLPDATSGASLLGKMQSANMVDAASGASLAGEMSVGSGVASYADILKNMLNDGQTLKDMFFGYRSGCVGETSILLFLAAFLFLLITRTIDWRAPVAMIVTAFVAAFALGLNPLLALLSGGLMFGAVYMTTDYVTAPVTPVGKIIFGMGAGLITILIRKYGNYPEGVCYSILIMNCAVPFLNKLLPRKYGFVPKKAAAKGGTK
jgi:electron transport complex protein RnfD